MVKWRAVLILACYIAVVVMGQTYNYDIMKASERIGSCRIEMEKRGGGYFIRKNAEITQGQDVQSVEEEIIVDGNWIPEDYSLDAESKVGKVSLNLDFTDKGVQISGKLGMGEVNQLIETEDDVSIWSERICMTSALILLPRLDYTVMGRETEFPVILPENMELDVVSLTVKSHTEQGYLVNGSVPGGWEFEAWFDPEKKYIAKYSVKGGYSAVPAQEEKNVSADLPAGYNPIPPMLLQDSEFLSRLRNTENLTAVMSFIYPEEIAERLYLNRFSQEFAGVITAGEVSGNIEVNKMGHKVTNAPDWPLYYDLRGVDEMYLMPERGIDSDDPDIKERSDKTVKPAKTMWDAARAINLWVYRNVEYAKVTAGASETFESLQGDSRAKSLLCAAMCRSVGIPARIVSGVLYAEGPTDHSWVEVYLGEEVGWGPMDPTLGEADDINAAHISLWLGTQMPPVYAKDITFENVNLEY